MRAGSSLVIFFESGRLGNQLLQYAVLRTGFDGRLLFFGGDSLRRAVPCERTWFFPGGRGWNPVWHVARSLLGWLAAARIVGEAREQRDGEDCRLAIRPGLLRAIVYARESFFQHAAFEAHFAAALTLDRNATSEAARFVAHHAAGRVPVFLHVRRGDYLAFPTPAAPAAVSAQWILAALSLLRVSIPRAMVFVCTDDQQWVRELLRADEVVYCDHGELVDLAVMAACEGGVMSASSFSWCGAFLARQSLAAQGRTGLFIAPRYWIGHRRGEWHPAGFRFPWITYL